MSEKNVTFVINARMRDDTNNRQSNPMACGSAASS